MLIQMVLLLYAVAGQERSCMCHVSEVLCAVLFWLSGDWRKEGDILVTFQAWRCGVLKLLWGE